MKKAFIFLLMMSIYQLKAQSYFYGISMGSALFQHTQSGNHYQNFTYSLPNIQIGKQITSRSALLLYLPGTLYSYKESGRHRDRGFEAIIPSYRLGITTRLSCMAGVGIGMDAPAFYDIKNEEERKFYFGLAASSSVSYVIIQRKKMNIDLQARIQFGKIAMEKTIHEGISYSLLLGINLHRDVQRK